jgi:hypothetical protein
VEDSAGISEPAINAHAAGDGGADRTVPERQAEVNKPTDGVYEALDRISQAAAHERPRLTLAGLDLTALPIELGALTGLRELDLSGNLLSQLPPWLGRLTALERLTLRGNRLVALPESLLGLGRLADLDLSGNQFVEIPRWLGRLGLERVDVSGNPDLIAPPPHVAAAGGEPVLDYLRQRAAGIDHPNVAVAVVTARTASPATGETPAEFAPANPAAAEAAAAEPGLFGAPWARLTVLTGRPRRKPAAVALTAAVLVAIVLVSVLHTSGGGPAAATAQSTNPAYTSPVVVPVLPLTPSATNRVPAAGATPTVSPSPSPSRPAPASPPPPAPSPPGMPMITPTIDAQALIGAITSVSGLCLDDANARSVPGNQIDVFTCNGTKAQVWTVDFADRSIRVLGMCLDLTDGSRAKGTVLVIEPCDGTPSQLFLPLVNGELYNAYARRCVDAPDTAPNALVQLGNCTAANGQTWLLPGVTADSLSSPGSSDGDSNSDG